MNNNNNMSIRNFVYDWNAPLMSGTIVCAKFADFDREEKIGLFCILYDEQLDGNILNKQNVLAIKLTTQQTTMGDYTVAINMERNPYLQNLCSACCSKVHILHKKKQVYKILGMLDKATYNRIVKTYVNFQSKVEKQVLDRI